AAGEHFPSALPQEVRYEQERRDLAGDRQRQHDAGAEVAAPAEEVQGQDDEEQDEDVDVAVRQVAEDGAQAQEHGERLGPGREGPLGGFDEAEGESEGSA